MLYLALYCTNTIILLINIFWEKMPEKWMTKINVCLCVDVILTVPLNTQEKIDPKSFVPEKIIHCKL
jgi:hypothetical protein